MAMIDETALLPNHSISPHQALQRMQDKMQRTIDPHRLFLVSRMYQAQEILQSTAPFWNVFFLEHLPPRHHRHDPFHPFHPHRHVCVSFHLL